MTTKFGRSTDLKGSWSTLEERCLTKLQKPMKSAAEVEVEMMYSLLEVAMDVTAAAATAAAAAAAAKAAAVVEVEVRPCYTLSRSSIPTFLYSIDSDTNCCLFQLRHQDMLQDN